MSIIKKLKSSLIASALIVIGVLVFYAVPQNRPVLVDAYSGPQLTLPNNPMDIGIVTMDTVSKHKIPLQNTGGEALMIEKVEASCGCTIVAPDERFIPAGKTTFLNLTMDASLKLGPIEKTVDIYTNDTKQPHQTLLIKAHSVAPKGAKTHDGKIQVKDPLVLFKGDCKSCHVDRGVGKVGEELFIADCGMCHGLQAEGGVAPGLLGFDMTDESQKAYARDVIANGAKMNPTMPPFSSAKGGPLSDEQIDSLVNYLAYLSSQAKKENAS